MQRLLVLGALFFASMAHSVVDMKNANYADTWLDLSVPSQGFDLKVQRTYNSRSQFSGMFGYGWCSDYETKIEPTPEGNLLLTECGGGLEISYFPDNYDQDSINKYVDEIIGKVKKKNKTGGAKYFETLTFQLRQDDELRAIWAKDVGIGKRSLKSGTVFLANGKEVERIEFDGSTYERYLPDGTKQKYTKAGKLASVSDKNNNSIKLVYQEDQLKEVVDNNGRKLSFSYTLNKKLKSITGPNNLKADYEFKSEDLAVVKNAWKNTYNYKYDSGHNLIRLEFPDKTAKVLTYDQSKDWVTSFKDRNACEEKYEYTLSKNDPLNQYSANAVRTCGGKQVNKNSNEFWHRTRADGKKFLFRIKSVTPKENLEIVYHEVFGKPVSIKKNGTVTMFSYYPNGLVKEKSSDNIHMEYKYKNPYRKVSEVITKYNDAKGKQLRTVSFEFAYDKKGNMVTASNTEGQKVAMKYDGKGRVVSFVDQARKEVLIRYDEKSGKPSQISRPSVGAIDISYTPSGQMKKPESKGGSIVALQIASTFNNFLDVVAPAAGETNF